MRALVGRISPLRQRGLVRPSYADPLLTAAFQRNSLGLYQLPNTVAGDFGIAAANAPRFTTSRLDLGLNQYADPMLLFEAQRSNYIQNPRFEGGTSGDLSTTGVLPTGCSYVPIAGVTFTYTRLNALQGAILRLSMVGTPSVTGVAALLFENVGLTGLAFNDTTYGTMYMRRRSGALTNLAILSWGPIKDSGGNIVVDTQVDETANITGSFKRFLNRSVAGVAGVGGPYSRPQFGAIFSMISGQAVNVTMEWMFPSLSVGTWNVSPSLPPAGTPGVSVRQQDTAFVTMGAWNRKAPFSMLFTGKRQAFTGDAQLFGLCEINDNTFNNRVYLYNDNQTNNVVVQAANAGVYNGPFSMGAYTPDTQFKLAITVDGTNIRSSLNGAVVVVSPAPTNPALFTNMSIGSLGAATAPTASWNGEIGVADYLPYPLSDAQLRAAST